MALLTFLEDPSPSSCDKREQINKKRNDHNCKQPQQQWQQQPPPASSSWDQFKNLLSCKKLEPSSEVHDPSRAGSGSNAYSMLSSTCSSVRYFKDVVHGNTTVIHRSDNSCEGRTAGQEVGLLKKRSGHGRSSSSRSLPSSSSLSAVHGGGMKFRKLSGCYECRTIVYPSRRYPYTPTSAISTCSKCGKVFPNAESLELHQAVGHAVSELGPDDSGRNIVEIIFKSSWHKKDSPVCQIERILKVHNTQRTIQRFEECRDDVKACALAGARRNPRCAADGNELLRFHCAALACSLGSHGSSRLCCSVCCRVCTIIRHGFQGKSGQGHGDLRTTASSGRAHDLLSCSDGRRAMLVCRVIAGKVKLGDSPVAEDGIASSSAVGTMTSSYDSVAGRSGMYGNLEDLLVFDPKAVLPCFVIIYRAMEG